MFNFQDIWYNENGDMMKNRKELLRKVKFTLFSISAGVLEIGVFTLLTMLTNWNYWACYLPALVLSVIWNYFLNRKYTFYANDNISTSLLEVFLFYAVFTPSSTLLGNYLAEDLGWNEFFVTALNMLLNFVLEYLYDCYIVFRNHIDEKKLSKE